MTLNRDERTGTPQWSLAGFQLGMRLALPILSGMIAFGLAVGATAARKGLSFVDSLLMNVFVYAGMSQLLAFEVWPGRFTSAALAGLALLCLTVNARMLLIGASLHPWLGGLPPWQIYPALHLVTDPGWLLMMRYRAENGSDAGVYLGSAVALAIAWMVAASVGHLVGVLIVDPRPFAIDLIMPIFFAATLVPLWRGVRRGGAWVVAGVVSLAVQQLAGGWWFIVAGALAGSVAGGFLDADD